MSNLSQSAFNFYLQSLPDEEIINLDDIQGDLSIGIEDITISSNIGEAFALKPPVSNRKRPAHLNVISVGENVYRTLFSVGEILRDDVELLKMKYYETKLEFLKLMKSMHPKGTKLLFMHKRPGGKASLKLMEGSNGYELRLYGVCQDNLRAIHEEAQN